MQPRPVSRPALDEHKPFAICTVSVRVYVKGCETWKQIPNSKQGARSWIRGKKEVSFVSSSSNLLVQDPFTLPSHLIMKDPKEYAEALPGRRCS